MSDARTRLSKTAQLLRDFCNEGDCHICKGCDFYELCEVGDTPKAIAEAIENELATCMSNEYIVTETCPHCGSEIEMRWSVEELGYKAFCPVCGERLMLCDECLHDADGNCTGNCDYDGKTDTCKYNKTPKADGRKAELDYILKYVEESDFSAFSLNQLICLWTAYCFHNSLDCDTAQYDNDLVQIWVKLCGNPTTPFVADQFTAFDLWLGKYLS